MANTYGKNINKHNNIISTIITIIVVFTVFGGVLTSFYIEAEDEAYETLYLQTQQIKDELTLQIKSDYENLSTMAEFAKKLYINGADYSLMFDSFKPIGLYSRIGILTPDGIFTTKDESVNINETITFEQAVLNTERISGRTYSYSKPNEEVIRSSIPIQVNGEIVAIIYGITKIETINEKYNDMASKLDAQLFVYNKDNGKFIIDTINKSPADVSTFQNRKYNDGYSYKQLLTTDSGFSSFRSILNDEYLYAHYSTIEDFNWVIMLARYESQVFQNVKVISRRLTYALIIMILAATIYLYIIISNEKKRTIVVSESSEVRKLLLSVNIKNKNIDEALKRIKTFLKARRAFFFDSDGDDYNDDTANNESPTLYGDDRKFFIGELLRYSAILKSNSNSTINYMNITTNAHLAKTNKKLYDFLIAHKIANVSFIIIFDENNHTSILGVTNPQNKSLVSLLLKDTAICFSIAIYNNKHLSKTEFVSMTDSLTGVANRVAYKRDVIMLNSKKPSDFACVFIDVNELNLMNNKYGHSAGDEMLVYIANSLKEVFFGHHVYRMGGDEFLVFTEGIEELSLNEKISTVEKQLAKKEYTVSAGVAFRGQFLNCEEVVRDAEIKMYDAKAHYYQNKENNKSKLDISFEQIHTGIKEVDAMLSIIKEHYHGIYKVSLQNDSVHRVLTSTYLGYKDKKKKFSDLLLNYIDDLVHPDSRRIVMSFLNYDVIKQQLQEGKIPSTVFVNLSGEKVKLSIYNITAENEDINDTLWVFAKV